jgi:hypothetical protein
MLPPIALYEWANDRALQKPRQAKESQYQHKKFSIANNFNWMFLNKKSLV